MYPISDNVLQLFKDNYRQVANIIIRKGSEVVATLTEADVLQGGLSIDRYSLSGTRLEIGSAIAAELKLKLDNRDNRFADISFEGAEIEVNIGVKKWDSYKWENAQIEWIPCGFFTVDDSPRKLSSISLSALDRMVKFDVRIANNLFPTTVGMLLQTCCTNCGVELATSVLSLLNNNYMVTFAPEEDEEITYRQLIKWIAEITGTCAYVDWNGRLRLDWYRYTPTVITSADRYEQADLHENDIMISGVQVTDHDDNKYLAGTDDYALYVDGNKLITYDYDTIASSLNNRLNGFTYRPYSCRVKSMPHLYPFDYIKYEDKNGVKHNTIISHCTFKMNAVTTIAGKGETNKKNAYALGNPLTKQESIVIDKLKKKVSDGDDFVMQSFVAADGVLDSKITTEILRASEAETTLSSRITQNADSIAVEVTRAITAEGELSSNIQILSGEVSSKVSETGGSDSSFSWSLKSTGFTLKANDETVMSVIRNGGLTIKGVITALSGGTIGGFNISTDSLLYEHATDASKKVVIGTNGIKIGNETFKVDNSGTLIAKDIQLVLDEDRSIAISADGLKIVGTTSSGFAADCIIGHKGHYTDLYASTTTVMNFGFFNEDDIDHGGMNGANATDYTAIGIKMSKVVNGVRGATIDIFNKDTHGVINLSAPNINSNVPIIIGSDVSLKNTIVSLKHQDIDGLFDRLNPVSYRYNETSDITRFGFIAQDVEAIVKDFPEFSNPIVYTMAGNGKKYLCYQDFIALNTWQIQKLKERVRELEKGLNKQK